MKKIFRMAIVFAVAGAALLTGCTKDYGTEIADLKNQVSSLSQKVDDLQSKISSGATITSVNKLGNGIEIVLSDGAKYVITNGEKGEKGDKGDTGATGAKGDKGDTGAAGAKGATGATGATGAKGDKGDTGAKGDKGDPGKDGTVVTISEDGYWVLDGVKQENFKAVGEKGEKGEDGLSWSIKEIDGVLYFVPSDETKADKVRIYPEGTQSGLTAVWADKALTIYGVQDAPNGQGFITIDLACDLKGLAFIPERIFDGLGLISVWNVDVADNAKTLNNKYPYVKVAASERAAKFLTTAPTKVAYRFNPQNADPAGYDYAFVNRSVYTKAVADKGDLVSIVSGPTADNGHYDFEIKLNKVATTADHAQTNDIVALKATAKDGTSDDIVSDYSYIENVVNWSYAIIHKDGYKAGKPKFYRKKAEHVVIKAATDYNDKDGITVNEKGELIDYDETKANPATIVLPYKSTGVDVLDYVETYAFQKEDLASTLGLEPKYDILFASVDTTDYATKGAVVTVGADKKKVKYESDDADKTNQNEFITLTGSTIKVDTDFVPSAAPAINRTPLLYVRSYVEVGGTKYYLAEAFIKVQIIGDETTPTNKRGWKIFLKHDVKFENLTATQTYKGTSGTFSAKFVNHKAQVVDSQNKDLAVVWAEVNQYVLDLLTDIEGNAGMSYDAFASAYDLDNPRLIFAKNGTNPKEASLKSGDEDCLAIEKKDAYLDPVTGELPLLSDIASYYDGIGYDFTSPANWKQNTNIVNITINNTAGYKPHKVFVLFEAWDNTLNEDVIFEFDYVYTHNHTFTIGDWILNPDYILGTQNHLVETKPAATAYYGEEPYETYGGVRIKGQGNTDNTAFIEHFKEYKIKTNDESKYEFKIMNYKKNIVDIDLATAGKGTVSYTTDDYAYWTVDGADLKAVVEGALGADVLLLNRMGLEDQKDILVQVTETCKADNTVKKVGYYYIVFEATAIEVVCNDILLGTYRIINDYATASELIKSIKDKNSGTDLFEKDADGVWVPTEAAKTVHGVPADAKVVITINKLTYNTTVNPQSGEVDTKESFGGRLGALDANQDIPGPAEPDYRIKKLEEPCINWWNMGTDLQNDKFAGFEISFKYTSQTSNIEVVPVKATGKLTVLSTDNSAKDPKWHAYHTFRGYIWTPGDFPMNDEPTGGDLK